MRFTQLHSLSISIAISLQVIANQNHDTWVLLLRLLQCTPSTVRQLNIGFASSGMIDWVLRSLDWGSLGDEVKQLTNLEDLAFTNCRFQFLKEEMTAIREQIGRLKLSPEISLRFRDGDRE